MIVDFASFLENTSDILPRFFAQNGRSSQYLINSSFLSDRLLITTAPGHSVSHNVQFFVLFFVVKFLMLLVHFFSPFITLEGYSDVAEL